MPRDFECPASPGSTGETHIHLLAKSVLRDRRYLTLPALKVFWSGHGIDIAAQADCEFDDVILERRRGDIIPDAICSDGRCEIAVEFTMTHKVDRAKEMAYAQMGLSAIEIDVSRLWEAEDPEEQAMSILQYAPRRWINNRVTRGVEIAIAQAAGFTGNDVEGLVRRQMAAHGAF